MGIEKTVHLDSVYDAAKFVEEIAKLPSDIDAMYNSKTVDAKSYLGILLISSHPIRLVLNSSDDEEISKFLKICEKYQKENK